jgi:hypothetical protein
LLTGKTNQTNLRNANPIVDSWFSADNFSPLVNRFIFLKQVETVANAGLKTCNDQFAEAIKVGATSST